MSYLFQPQASSSLSDRGTGWSPQPLNHPFCSGGLDPFICDLPLIQLLGGPLSSGLPQTCPFPVIYCILVFVWGSPPHFPVCVGEAP